MQSLLLEDATDCYMKDLGIELLLFFKALVHMTYDGPTYYIVFLSQNLRNLFIDPDLNQLVVDLPMNLMLLF